MLTLLSSTQGSIKRDCQYRTNFTLYIPYLYLWQSWPVHHQPLVFPSWDVCRVTQSLRQVLEIFMGCPGLMGPCSALVNSLHNNFDKFQNWEFDHRRLVYSIKQYSQSQLMQNILQWQCCVQCCSFVWRKKLMESTSQAELVRHETCSQAVRPVVGHL